MVKSWKLLKMKAETVLKEIHRIDNNIGVVIHLKRIKKVNDKTINAKILWCINERNKLVKKHNNLMYMINYVKNFNNSLHIF